MISTRWLEQRRQHWGRLEALLEQSRKHGVRALARSELRELGLLYRQAASDLSTLREDSSAQHFARYLNQLLGRAHNTIYSGSKSSASALVRFYTRDYPRIFRTTLPYTLTALGLFALGALLGLLLTTSRPEFMHSVLGPHMIETLERREMWTHSILSMKPVASSSIMTNNLSVSFVAFAAGITGGLGTIYLLAMNGVLLGVISAACWLTGMSLPFWSFVAPHGVLELPAIFIAGGAGLRLAHGLLFPGSLLRRDSLAVAGGEAVRMVVGVIPMLILAGIVEGFISPSFLPAAMKFLLSGSLFFLLVVYLGSAAPRLTAGPAPSPAGSGSPGR